MTTPTTPTPCAWCGAIPTSTGHQITQSTTGEAHGPRETLPLCRACLDHTRSAAEDSLSLYDLPADAEDPDVVALQAEIAMLTGLLDQWPTP